MNVSTLGLENLNSFIHCSFNYLAKFFNLFFGLGPRNLGFVGELETKDMHPEESRFNEQLLGSKVQMKDPYLLGC